MLSTKQLILNLNFHYKEIRVKKDKDFNFNNKEKHFVKLVDECKTFADVKKLAEDILGYHNNSSITPRHAKSYRNFDKIFQDIQKERIKAFKKYQADVSFKKFPLKKHSVLADQKELIKFKKLITDYNNGNK